MHKSKLHELCQQKQWKLPEYSTSKDGPDHNSCFTTILTINGLSFQSSNPCKTIKAAKDSAAEVALNHLSGSSSSSRANDAVISLSSVLPDSQNGLEAELTIQEHTGNVTPSPLIPSGVTSNKKFQDGQHWYKSRLQTYAQKKNIDLPAYSCERQGPPHASRFKCKVTVDGQCYEGTDFFVTQKEAQNDAAKIAFEQVSLKEDQKNLQDNFGLQKNALQELAQKRGFMIPSYKTISCGPGHSPTFLATVIVDGKTYQGLAAKSKKQAEVNAAKSAYDSLQNVSTEPLHLNDQHQPIAFTEENQHQPIAFTEENQHQPIAFTEENQHQPIAFTEENQHQPIAFTEENQHQPITFTEENQHQPIAFTEENQHQPIAFTEENQHQPIAFTEKNQRQPIAFTEENQRQPIAFTEENQHQPIAFTEENQHQPIAFTEENQRQPIAFTEENQRQPIAFTEENQHQPITFTEENLQMAVKCETQLNSKEPVPSDPNTKTTATDNGKRPRSPTQSENEPNTKTAAADNGKRSRSPSQCENTLQARNEGSIGSSLHKILVYSSPKVPKLEGK